MKPRLALTFWLLAAVLAGCSPVTPVATPTATEQGGRQLAATAVVAVAAPATATRAPAATRTAAPSATPTALPTGTATPAPPTATSTPPPTATATPPSTRPPATAGPTATPDPELRTDYRVTEITLPTYPYAAFLKGAGESGPVVYPVSVLDRGAYEAAGPRATPAKHRLLVLENKYLRLGILPDLGGRIYECTFKPTGNNEFYSNSVIKPTQWGPGSPAGANWWLAVGGLEWGFPVEEHGYEFGAPWGFDHAALGNGGVMVTLFTRNGPQEPYAVVDIILPPDTAYFVVQPRIVNPLAEPFRFKWWANAMLAPGAANRVSADLRFLLPATEVTVHSTGDPTLPQAGQALTWPVFNGRDLSRLAAWNEYLGFFQRPAASGNFAGVYDSAADEGLLRIYPANVARGVKIFAAGFQRALDPQLWTDDGSSYVELHGGLEPTFDDWHELGPGREVTWAEFWYPVAGLGGVTWADDAAALYLAAAPGGQRVALAPTSALRGRLTVEVAGAAPFTADVDMAPDRPFVGDVPLPAGAGGQTRVTLVDEVGRTVFQYTGQAAAP